MYIGMKHNKSKDIRVYIIKLHEVPGVQLSINLWFKGRFHFIQFIPFNINEPRMNLHIFIYKWREEYIEPILAISYLYLCCSSCSQPMFHITEQPTHEIFCLRTEFSIFRKSQMISPVNNLSTIIKLYQKTIAPVISLGWISTRLKDEFNHRQRLYWLDL